jgi:hypothetical protein
MDWPVQIIVPTHTDQPDWAGGYLMVQLGKIDTHLKLNGQSIVLYCMDQREDKW